MWQRSVLVVVFLCNGTNFKPRTPRRRSRRPLKGLSRRRRAGPCPSPRGTRRHGERAACRGLSCPRRSPQRWPFVLHDANSCAAVERVTNGGAPAGVRVALPPSALPAPRGGRGGSGLGRVGVRAGPVGRGRGAAGRRGLARARAGAGSRCSRCGSGAGRQWGRNSRAAADAVLVGGVHGRGAGRAGGTDTDPRTHLSGPRHEVHNASRQGHLRVHRPCC